MVERFGRREALASADADDLLGLGDVEAAFEHRRLREAAALLGGGQEVVAPGDRPLQRPLARRSITRPRPGERQPGGQRSRIAAGGSNDSAPRRARCRAAGRRAARRSRRRSAGPAGLPAGRTARARSTNSCGAASRAGSSGSATPPTPSGRTGYSCSPPRWSGARLVTMIRDGRRHADERRDLAGSVEEVLEVVEHEHHRAIGQERRQRLGRRALDPIEQPERSRDRRP